MGVTKEVDTLQRAGWNRRRQVCSANLKQISMLPSAASTFLIDQPWVIFSYRLVPAILYTGIAQISTLQMTPKLLSKCRYVFPGTRHHGRL